MMAVWVNVRREGCHCSERGKWVQFVVLVLKNAEWLSGGERNRDGALSNESASKVVWTRSASLDYFI